MTNDLNNTPEKTEEQLVMAELVAEKLAAKRKVENEERFKTTLKAASEKDETLKNLIALGTIDDIIKSNPSLTQMNDSAAGVDAAMAIAVERFKAEEARKNFEKQKSTVPPTPVDAPLHAGGGGVATSANDSDPIDFRRIDDLKFLEKSGVSREKLAVLHALHTM